MQTIYVILTILKAAVITIGMGYCFLNLISWTRTKEGKKLKKAAIVFGGVFLSILVISIIEVYCI